MADPRIDRLVTQHKLVSDQVSADQIKTILSQTQRIVDQSVSGAVVELGCYIGTTSLFIRRLLDLIDADRPFHVYDSFAGLPEKTSLDASRAGEQFVGGELAVSKKSFVNEFKKAGLKPPIIHKGWFSDLTPADLPEMVAMAFLDGDFYESISDSMRLVLPKMSLGGVIIVDDYASEALPGVAKAVHQFFMPDEIVTIHNQAVIRVK